MTTKNRSLRATTWDDEAAPTTTQRLISRHVADSYEHHQPLAAWNGASRPEECFSPEEVRRTRLLLGYSNAGYMHVIYAWLAEYPEASAKEVAEILMYVHNGPRRALEALGRNRRQ